MKWEELLKSAQFFPSGKKWDGPVKVTYSFENGGILPKVFIYDKETMTWEDPEKKRKEEEEKKIMEMPMMQSLLDMQAQMTKVIAEANADAILEQMMPKIEDRITEVFGFVPQIHEIRTPNYTSIVKDVIHEKFEEVLQIVNLDIPVFLTGKAGTGKNVICKQVADALGLDFYFTNAVTQEYKLTGFIDANGKYQETQFFKAFTQGGLFFLDEMDASIPEVLVILNAAIANRYFDFPIGKIEAHPNFRVIAAGNTTGLGADTNYTGRYCLDRASLDRFAMVYIDYSNAIETAMSLGKKDLVTFAHVFRNIAEETGIECLFSYRTIERIAKLEDVIPDLSEVLSISLLKGLNKEDTDMLRKKLVDNKGMKNNKYAIAFCKFDF